MIVVTTPTGEIGSKVLQGLLNEDATVRVVVRDASKLPDEVRSRVEVVEGSHGEPAVLRTAFDGADSVFWVVPPDPTAPHVDDAYTGFSRPALEVFRRGGVGRVVGISALGRHTAVRDHAGYVSATLRLDDAIAATGVPYRAVVNPSFMDNLLNQARSIRDRGVITSLIRGDLKAPSVATSDIASTAVRLLIDGSWTGFEEVPCLGPEDLSWADFARITTEEVGLPVRFRQISLAEYKARFVSFGLSDAMAQGMTDMAEAKDAGLDNGVTRTLENTTPTTFRSWVREVLVPAVQLDAIGG